MYLVVHPTNGQEIDESEDAIESGPYQMAGGSKE
jgi:hypothetical protein